MSTLVLQRRAVLLCRVLTAQLALESGGQCLIYIPTDLTSDGLYLTDEMVENSEMINSLRS